MRSSTFVILRDSYRGLDCSEPKQVVRVIGRLGQGRGESEQLGCCLTAKNHGDEDGEELNDSVLSTCGQATPVPES